MSRKPRKQSDHLVTARLLTHAYGQMGEIATAGGFFSYFVTMTVYGFPYSNIFFLLSVNCVLPTDPATNQPSTTYNNQYTYDQFNTTVPFGNSFIPANASLLNSDNFNTNFPDWISPVTNEWDLRGFYLIANPGNGYNATFCAPASTNSNYCQTFNWPTNE